MLDGGNLITTKRHWNGKFSEQQIHLKHRDVHLLMNAASMFLVNVMHNVQAYEKVAAPGRQRHGVDNTSEGCVQRPSNCQIRAMKRVLMFC
jgi:hypothetical protein